MRASVPRTLGSGRGKLHGLVPEVANAGEQHGGAGGDHLVVAQAAAGLDRGGGAGIQGRLEAVREREEGVPASHRACFEIVFQV
jgi:hypothetical protein